MADVATATGVVLPSERSWPEFTRPDGEKVAAGSVPEFHLYDPDARTLTGPFGIRTDLREEFTSKVPPLSRITVQYRIYPGRNGKIDRTADNWAPPSDK